MKWGDFSDRGKKAREISVSGGWQGGQKESKEAGARDNHWCRGMFESSGENGVASRRVASGGRDGVKKKQGLATVWTE